jgi:phage N-6-adenine-methyltransferase
MQLNKALFSSKKSDWETPQYLFDALNKEFNFGLDACATKENAKCPIYFSLEDKLDGLELSWHSMTGTAWLNPPYGKDIAKWVKKAWEESTKMIVVCLLPARTDTRWWHSYVWDRFTNRANPSVKEIRFLKGRLKFGNSKNSAPFPSAVVIFDRRHLNK